VRRAEVYQTAALAGYLTETEAKEYRFEYVAGYKGCPVSLTIPVRTEPYEFDKFPPFFEGLLPEWKELIGGIRRTFQTSWHCWRDSTFSLKFRTLPLCPTECLFLGSRWRAKEQFISSLRERS
jgi:serine/threonine-protein kinase HipA